MPLRVRCDPQLPKMMQREHRDEATDVLPATFLNEAIRLPILFVAAQFRAVGLENMPMTRISQRKRNAIDRTARPRSAENGDLLGDGRKNSRNELK
jgi:hypothetical protein